MKSKLFKHMSLPEMYSLEVDKDNKIYFEVSGKKDGIIVSFDPIDGSKNIETNTSVGTIYCFLQYSVKEDKITKVIEAGYCLYGFTTIVVRATDEEVTLYKLNNCMINV